MGVLLCLEPELEDSVNRPPLPAQIQPTILHRAHALSGMDSDLQYRRTALRLRLSSGNHANSVILQQRTFIDASV